VLQKLDRRGANSRESGAKITPDSRESLQETGASKSTEVGGPIETYDCIEEGLAKKTSNVGVADLEISRLFSL